MEIITKNGITPCKMELVAGSSRFLGNTLLKGGWKYHKILTLFGVNY